MKYLKKNIICFNILRKDYEVTTAAEAKLEYWSQNNPLVFSFSHCFQNFTHFFFWITRFYLFCNQMPIIHSFIFQHVAICLRLQLPFHGKEGIFGILRFLRIKLWSLAGFIFNLQVLTLLTIELNYTKIKIIPRWEGTNKGCELSMFPDWAI